MSYYCHYTNTMKEWPYDAPRQPHPCETPDRRITVKDLKIDDPLQFRTNIPVESARDWNNLHQLSINKVDRTYRKHGCNAPDEVKLEFGKRQIDIAVREQQTLLEHDGYFHHQAKHIESNAWNPITGDERRRNVLKASADRLESKYGVEDVRNPTFTRTLQNPPNQNSWGSRLKRTLTKTGKGTEKGLEFLAGLEDKSGLPSQSGAMADQFISAVPHLSKSGAFDALDTGNQVAHGILSFKTLPTLPIKQGFKYYNAYENAINTMDRQHELVRNRATAKHTQNLEQTISSQRKIRNKRKSNGKEGKKA